MNRSRIIAAVVVVVALAGIVSSQIFREKPGQTIAAGEQTTAAAPESPGVDEAPAPADPDAEAEAPPNLGQKPELTDLDGWLQTDATSLADFDGQVRIVEFWTFGCFNCQNVIPHHKEIYAKYQPQGLEYIGIHSPEFDFEKDPDAVAQATKDADLPWPIALDTNKTNFQAWQEDRRFWPRTYVLDRGGNIRHDHIGEGGYEELEEVVAFLIENPSA